MYPTQVLPLTRSCILDLDSSTNVKFSRHWIVHLPNNVLFPNAIEVGKFVKLFVGRLAEEIATGKLHKLRPMLAKYLFVKSKENSQDRKSRHDVDQTLSQSQSQSKADENSSKYHNTSTTCLVDLGVYTRNRLFRLMGATKYGKPSTAALRIASSNEFVFHKGFSNDNFYLQRLGKEQESKGEEEDGKEVKGENEFKNWVS